MTGGGFGGSAIALVEAADVHRVAEAVASAFTTAGFAEPAFLEARAAGPGARVS
jgi:galactokinase